MLVFSCVRVDVCRTKKKNIFLRCARSMWNTHVSFPIKSLRAQVYYTWTFYAGKRVIIRTYTIHMNVDLQIKNRKTDRHNLSLSLFRWNKKDLTVSPLILRATEPTFVRSFYSDSELIFTGEQRSLFQIENFNFEVIHVCRCRLLNNKTKNKNKHEVVQSVCESGGPLDY